MSILIVDPDQTCRNSAKDIFRWADARQRIDTAKTGEEAKKIALAHKPKLVLCEPNLPDASFELLRHHIRTWLPATYFVGYLNLSVDDGQIENCFDNVLPKPPSRLGICACMSAMKRQASNAKPAPKMEAPARWRHKLTDTTEHPNKILVALEDEPDLRFSIGVPHGASISSTLAQLGKRSVTQVTLVRTGKRLAASLFEEVRDGDALILRCSS